MKRVLYVFGGEEASGAEFVIQRLFKYNTAVVEPHLFVSPGKFADEVVNNKICPVTQLNALKKLNRARIKGFGFIIKALKNYFVVSGKVLDYVRKNNIDIVHANTIVPASYLIPAIVWSKITFKKTKWFWSDHDLQYFSQIDHIVSKLCLKLFDATLVVSDAVKKKFGSASEKLMILYNGLDLNDFIENDTLRRNFREKYNIADNQLLFCIAGVVSPRKGQIMLIKVFSQLAAKYDHIKLVFAGRLSEDTPEYYQTFLGEVEKNKESILYIGKVNDMVSLYNGIDVLYNNSSNEGSEPLGTTILEAMAMHKIVIASKVGGSPEIVTDKKDGFLFNADNESALMDITAQVIDNWYNLTAMRAQASIAIKERFDIEIMASNYNGIIMANTN
ncbi:glycosyltransferase family 4 protein [Mucilaginibacter gilvus]|uniref:Glycosyltransferase family 1 protein n=1 Tax=Mucilaginibacter gilvus TaxID=2305909 RepID=A0A3S3UMZ6_9SPHI|nr:glycosyltransferase family 4 protein [Mucilaginibacter gilvus]RWY50196.1 glycosyltransferase family 1 protein [Mucilaginibacter gilvus]